MADKGSPGSVSSISGYTTKSLSENEEPSIKIRRHPPPHVFPGEDFHIEYNVIGQAGQHTLATIQASLLSPAVGTAVLNTEGPTLGTKAAKLKCKIHIDAVPTSGAVLRIRLSSADDGVASADTNEVTLVIAKLTVEELEWESPFYKDLGGRDKGQLVWVGAYGADNLPHPQPVDFLPTLCYEGKNIPCDQSFFMVLQNSENPIHRIEPPHKRKFKFRVNSVSKNHAKRKFLVEFSAVGRGDIAPADTLALEVRSKPTRPHSNGPTSRQPHPSPRPSHGDDDPSPPGKRARQEVCETVERVVANVDRWMRMLVEGFAGHQWKLQGHAPNHDGSPNHHRPYYLMPRPNEFFQSAMREFDSIVRPQLNNLVVLANDNSEEHTNVGLLPDYHLPPQEPSDQPTFGPGGPTMPEHPGQNVPGHHPTMHPFYRDMVHPNPPDPGYYSPYAQHPHMLSAPHPSVHRSRVPPSSAPAYLHQVSDETRSIPSLPNDDSMDATSDSSESDVEYILTKSYASPETHERLGFPAFAPDRSLIGFYSYRHGTGTQQLVRLSRLSRMLTNDEVAHIVRCLSDAMEGRTGDYIQRQGGTPFSQVADQLAMSAYPEQLPRDGSGPGADHSSREG